jgi:hypothetical protein
MTHRPLDGTTPLSWAWLAHDRVDDDLCHGNSLGIIVATGAGTNLRPSAPRRHVEVADCNERAAVCRGSAKNCAVDFLTVAIL